MWSRSPRGVNQARQWSEALVRTRGEWTGSNCKPIANERPRITRHGASRAITEPSANMRDWPAPGTGRDTPSRGPADMMSEDAKFALGY